MTLRMTGVLAFSLHLALAAQAAETTNTIGMKPVPIQPGEFVMGQDGAREESPAHRVKITRPFAMSATEVTRGQWKALMGAQPPDMGLKDQTDQHPVVGVTWFEAVDFCKKLSAREGKTYRLPTEAEWEYACRAGTATAWSFGDKPDLARLICEADPPKDRAKPRVRTRTGPAAVASLPANAWGLHDMHGNVHEWCYDFFHGDTYLQTLLTRFMVALAEKDRPAWANPHKDWGCGYPMRPDCPTGEEIERKVTPRLAKALESPLADPVGPARGQADKRTIRGGGWGQVCRDCRSAGRMGADPLWRNQAIGFRVVREEGAEGLSVRLKYPPPPGEVEVAGMGRLPEIVVPPAGARFILVRPGTFLMGISPQEAKVIAEGRLSSAFGPIPQKKVTLSKPFYLASTLYTRSVSILNGMADLAAAMDGNTHYHPVGLEADRPDTQPMYDAIDRLLAMALRDGRNYRLPNDPEFEYATRAGTTTAWYWGNDAGVYFDYECLRGPGGEGDQPRHVGTKLPNPWGFYDMLCNSTQWTSTPREWKGEAEIVDPVGDAIGKPAQPETVYLRRGMGYRYQVAACGAGQLATKFGNYRNCTRVGGFRVAFAAAELKTRPIDDAWRQHIHALRVANFLAGGNYGLTFAARAKMAAGVNGAEGCGAHAVEYYGKALALDQGNRAAMEGLRRVRDELLPYWREKAVREPVLTPAVAATTKLVEQMLAAPPVGGAATGPAAGLVIHPHSRHGSDSAPRKRQE